MTLRETLRDDDDDGFSRREVLALGGASAFALGLLTADSEDGALLAAGGGGGGVEHTGTFGDWELAIVSGWDPYEPDKHPAVAVNSASTELRLFTGSVSLPTRTRGQTMEAIITDDISSIEINQFPSLVFDTGGEGQIRLIEEGDI